MYLDCTLFRYLTIVFYASFVSFDVCCIVFNGVIIMIGVLYISATLMKGFYIQFFRNPHSTLLLCLLLLVKRIVPVPGQSISFAYSFEEAE